MQPIFLVIEDDDLVAEDLVQILSDADPGVMVQTARSLEEAEDVVAGDARIDTAFIHAARDDIIASALMARLERARAGIVILNGEDLAHDRVKKDWAVVAVPFSSGMIESALAAVRSRQG